LQWQGHRRAYSRAIISTRVGHALKKCATRTTTKVLTGLGLRFFPRVSYRSSAVNSD
jgi:hypothetical protein